VSLSPAVRSFANGQILCREGDPPGPIYVICSGSVRAYRRSLTIPGEVQELARLGAGEVVGELAPLLGQLRSATVQAVESTKVLEIPIAHFGAMADRHTSLSRVVALALRDRAELSEQAVEAALVRVGGRLPSGVFAESVAADHSASFPTPPHDSSIAYSKPLTCPACGVRFSTLVVHARKNQPVGRSSDFHQRYETEHNPYDYELWVCPNDLYAALPADFENLPDPLKPAIAQAVEGVVADWGGEPPDFNGERSLVRREQGLILALSQYRIRQLQPLRIAAILHRLAWCARERTDADAENSWLLQALEAYSTAYRESALDDANEELRVLYLSGELSARTGDATSALRWFGEGLQHSSLGEHAQWDRIFRERWAEVRRLGTESLPGAS
jgi:uncharacterized protein